jgi:pyruvate,water dikinase
MTEDAHIAWIGEGRAEGLGGKGAGLDRLAALDLPVPEGFVVTADAFRAAVGPVARRLDAELAAQDPRSETFAARCAEARRDILEAAEAAGAPRDFADAYRRLSQGGEGGEGGQGGGAAAAPVAVRSSAEAEDSADASFAGEHDTYLWVSGERDVLERVRQCWASLYTERAVAYRQRSGHQAGRMAVVVQRMADARSSGVLMTLNPVNGDRSVIVVESVWGLGEALVSGEATPDRFTVDKITGEVRRRTAAVKRRMLTAAPEGGGTAWTEVPADRAETLSLDDAQLARLREVSLLLERHEGHPVDVEFAVDPDGRVLLLQVRPETVWSRRPRPAAQARSALNMIVSTLTSAR